MCKWLKGILDDAFSRYEGFACGLKLLENFIKEDSMSKTFCPCCGEEDRSGNTIVKALDALRAAGFKATMLVMNKGTVLQLTRGFTPYISGPDLANRGFYGMPIRIDNSVTKIRIEVEA